MKFNKVTIWQLLSAAATVVGFIAPMFLDEAERQELKKELRDELLEELRGEKK